MKEIKIIEPKTTEAVECALCSNPTKRVRWDLRCIGVPRHFDGRCFNALVAVPAKGQEGEGELLIATCDTCTAIACVEWAFAVNEHVAARIAKERLEEYEYAMLTSGI
jgi:hypothetical protein